MTMPNRPHVTFHIIVPWYARPLLNWAQALNEHGHRRLARWVYGSIPGKRSYVRVYASSLHFALRDDRSGE